MKTKGEWWKKRTKRRQMLERNGFAAEAPSARRKAWLLPRFDPYTPNLCMELKRKGLREKGFARVRKQRATKSGQSGSEQWVGWSKGVSTPPW